MRHWLIYATYPIYVKPESFFLCRVIELLAPVFQALDKSVGILVRSFLFPEIEAVFKIDKGVSIERLLKC